MTGEVRTLTLDPGTIGKLVLDGDLKGLTPAQRVDYYSYRCQQAGLDPAAKPFDLLTLNGKMVLYANAGCTQQLTATRKLSHEVTNRELVDGIYCVFVRVKGEDGRSTENMGAVPVEGLKGEAKANAMLKATTKAIRRAVLAHCGLGMLDETEAETIPGAKSETWEPKVETVAIEWTEEDYKEARELLNDLGQILMDFGVSEEDQKPILDKPASTIGDERGPENWKNRLHAYSQRTLAKFKPSEVAE